MSKRFDSILSFPCSFSFKIIGEQTKEFENFVVATMNKNFPDLTEAAIKSKLSDKGKYLALTVTVNAKSQEQLDNAYNDLSKSKLVLFAL